MKSRRMALLREHLLYEGVDAFVVGSLSNIRYLTGYSGSHGLCIVKRRGAYLITDSRYFLQARKEARGCRLIITRRGLYDALEQHGLFRGCRRVGFESDVVTYTQYRVMRRNAGGVSFVPMRSVVEGLSVVKEKKEVECIRTAARISDCVFHKILPVIKPGVTELDVAAEISYRQRKLGAENDAFVPIVASGIRSAFPHGRATGKRLRNRDLVVLDFGCTVAGYSSDLTRTVVIGRASKEIQRLYGVVLEAQCEAIGAAHGGMMARDLDTIARNRITREGYGKYFNHSLGHGLGLRLHEPPWVSSLSNELLVPGSVITIEPGVYLPGIGGVRIEDDVFLTPDGCEPLTRAPKQLTIV